MTFPIKFYDVLSDDLFDACFDELDGSVWGLNNASSRGLSRAWGMGTIHDNIPFFNAAVYIKLKILKHIQKKLYLVKIHVNGQTALQKGDFHHDFAQEHVWTFILFTNDNWNIQWGGEFICLDPETEEYHYIPYVPNGGVLIPSHWQHYGASPNNFTDELRTTLAFCYCLSEEVDNLISDHEYSYTYDSRHPKKFI
jgi:hypothetical protein